MTEFQKTLAVGLVLAAAAVPTVFGPPTVMTPYPVVVLVPLFVIGYPAVLLPPLLFWSWAPQLLAGESRVPRRSLVLLSLLTVLTPIYFVEGWQDGLRYVGPLNLIGVALLNVAVLLLLWVRLRRAMTQSSFQASLVFHGLLFGWLAWCAFPHLGELP